jgi:hypothetical protein
MKLVILALYASAAFATFVPSTSIRESQGHHSVFHQSRPRKEHEGSSRPPRLCGNNWNAKMVPRGDELPEVDIQAAIYDVASVVEQQSSEMRKAGVQLTKAMRNLEVAHQADLDNLDEVISATKRKKKYVEFAYRCLKLYTSKGTLTWTFTKESNQLMYEELSDWFATPSKFDKDLIDSCLAKHGFVYIKCKGDGRKINYNSNQDESYKLELGLFPSSDEQLQGDT